MQAAVAAGASGFPDATQPADWRLQIPEPKRRALRIWLWAIAATTFLVLVIGGVTRLTQSGLSIVDWQPLMGVVPPLSDAAWQERFDQYRQYPEYQVLRRGMSLAEFKFIYFWEYLHRLLARMIGVVFLIPFVFFWARGYFNRPVLLRSLALFGLGAMQGVLGWLMVRSGLIEQPSVSHYRLAAHLSLAFVIFGAAVWLARDLALGMRRPSIQPAARALMLRGLIVLGALLAVQIVWGAFVAGLKAGFMYNTFPLMGGRLVPVGIFGFEPALLNLVQNPVTVQWLHRLLGTVLGAAVLYYFLRFRSAGADPASRRLNAVFASLVLVQYTLGVLTLIMRVPVVLGVTHQAVAMVLFGVWVVWFHHARHAEPAEPGPVATTVARAGAAAGR